MLCSLFYFPYPGTVSPQCFCTCCYLCSEYPGHNGTCYLIFFFRSNYYVCEWFCLHIFICTMYISWCLLRSEEGFWFPGTVLGVIVIYMCVLGTYQHVPLPTEPSSSPSFLFFFVCIMRKSVFQNLYTFPCFIMFFENLHSSLSVVLIPSVLFKVVVVWTRLAHIGSYIWSISHQGVALFEKK